MLMVLEPPTTTQPKTGAPVRGFGYGAVWYAVLTKPGKEETVSLRIEAQDFVAFYPRRLAELRVNRKVRLEPRPLYPRYVFAGVPRELRDECGALFNTIGVSTVLHTARGPVEVPRTTIVRLMALADDDGIIDEGDFVAKPPKHEFVEGMDVTFTEDSPFSAWTGIVNRLDSNGKIEVIIKSHGNFWPVQEHYSRLVPADAAHGGVRQPQS